jgi:hypothetical protein
MLILLERSVTDLDGTYAMEDTDSMAIVATEHGGLISCPGGHHEPIQALSCGQVKQISEKFDALNPYERSAVRRSRSRGCHGKSTSGIPAGEFWSLNSGDGIRDALSEMRFPLPWLFSSYPPRLR